MFKKGIYRKIICILTFLVMSITCLSGAYALSLKTTNPSVEEVIKNTGKLIYKNTPNPSLGTFSGEWSILCLARGQIKVPRSYYDKYYSNIEKIVKQKKGILHRMKYTEYSRLIVGLTSINKDPRNVGGYNLLQPLSDFQGVINQGINGPIWALIAFDTNKYKVPKAEKGKIQVTREKLIDYILSKEIDGGGWAMSGNEPDPDITGMALQSLAPYKDEKKIKPYIERGLNVLSKLQNKDGGYKSWGTTNSESVSQVIVALCALGINPSKDPRFIKNNNWLVSNLIKFYVPGGGFKHVLDQQLDPMATDQGTYALIAYERFKNNKNFLYDMTDAKDSLVTGENPDLNKDDKKDNNNDNNKNKEASNKSKNKKNKKSNKKRNIHYPQKDEKSKSTSSSNSDNDSTSSQSDTDSDASTINESNDDNEGSTKTKKEATINFKIIYEGENSGSIHENKQCIVVEFPKRKDKVALVYDKKNTLYYSEELSKLSESPTYIGLIDKDIEKDDLKDMDKYKFSKDEGEKILFGDVNNDNIVNGQDVLNLQSIINGKLKISKDKQIIAANVTMDSKIDNGDIDSVINKYISNTDYKIFSIYNDENEEKEK